MDAPIAITTDAHLPRTRTAVDARDRLWNVACVAVPLLAALLYMGVWSGGLVWDDHYLIGGEAIGGGKSLLACFTQPFLNHFFRPLVSVSFFVERKLWGADAFGYHLTNTALHVLTTGLLMALLREAFGRRSVAVIGGLLFAVQPVQVGAVAWIGGRTDSLAALWVVLFAWGIVRAARSVGDARFVATGLAALAYTLALFTKEQTLALLPLVPLAFACWKPARGVSPPRAGLWAAVPFALSAVLFVSLGWFLGMPRPPHIPTTALGLLDRAGRTLCYYALVLLAPAPKWMHTLSLGALERAGAWPLVVGYGALAASLALLWRWRRTQPAACWFLALALLALLPVSGFVPLPFLLVAPYRAALVGIGFAAVMGWVAGSLGRWVAGSRSSSLIPHPSSLILAAVLAWHAGLTAWGAVQWRSDERLFRRIVRDDPDSIIGRYVLASVLDTGGQPAAGAAQQQRMLTLMLAPYDWRDGVAVRRALETDAALRARVMQNEGTDIEPRQWVALRYADLGGMRLRARDPAGARAALLAGEALSPGEGVIDGDLGLCAASAGDEAEAYRRMRAAAAEAPREAEPHAWLGDYYAHRGDWAQARREYAAWRDVEPQSADAARALADSAQHFAGQ